MNIRWMVVLLCLLCGSAYAVQLQPPAKICNLYFRGDVVFIGKLVSVVPYTGDNDGWTYTLRVIKSFWGLSKSTVSVHTEAGSAELILNKGVTYLLFAYRRAGGHLYIGSDGVSGDLTQHKLAVLKHVVSASHKTGGGEIYGRVVYYKDGPLAGLGGVDVRIIGNNETYHLISNAKGWFHAHVPAGKYSAAAASAKLRFEPFDLSRDNPGGFLVSNGGCAEIQISGKPKTVPPVP